MTEPNATEPNATEPKAAEPMLRVVSGSPTDEELAVLVAVFANAGGSSDTPAGPRNDWSRPVDRLRQTWHSPTAFPNQRW